MALLGVRLSSEGNSSVRDGASLTSTLAWREAHITIVKRSRFSCLKLLHVENACCMAPQQRCEVIL